LTTLPARLQTLLAALPVGLQRVAWAAVGPRSAWRWLTPATPWLLALATAAVVGLLAFVLLEAAFDYQPLVIVGAGALGAVVGLGLLGMIRPTGSGLALQLGVATGAAIVGVILGAIFTGPLVDAPHLSAAVAGILVGILVLGRRLQIARAARAAAEGVELVPSLIWILLILAVLPVIQAGAEATTTPATVAEFVERDVGGRHVVETDGLALLPAFPAEPPFDPARGPQGGPDPRRFSWFAVRAEAGDRRTALVRTTLDPSSLSRRDVVARVVDDPDGVRAAAEALERRGLVPGSSLGRRMLLALQPGDAAASDARGISSIADVADVEAGTVVRLTLDFPGEGIATCAAADRCQARRLGSGIGPWDHVAIEPEGAGSVLVRAAYPPSVAPIHIVGRQVRDPGAVNRFVSLPWIRELLGPAQVLRSAIIEHDGSLPVDRLWLGPILFVALAAAMAYGRRIGYPVFHGHQVRFGAWGGTQSQPPLGWRDVHARMTGRLTPPDRSPMEVDEVDVRIRPASSGPTIEITGLPERVEVAVPRELGTWSALQSGELRYISGSQPALQASWYGSQFRLVFDSNADRDTAAAMLRADVRR
jgi:hypothetical protein